MRNLQVTVLFAAVVIGMPLLPLLAQDTPGQATAMPQMSMSGMMADCQKQCDAMKATMADMTKTVTTTEKSTDVAKLHAALDRVQAGVAKMQAQMKDCEGMMQHMQHMMPMQGRGATTQPAPDAPHSH